MRSLWTGHEKSQNSTASLPLTALTALLQSHSTSGLLCTLRTPFYKSRLIPSESDKTDFKLSVKRKVQFKIDIRINIILK
jgi:hypothetical protein